MGIRFFCPQGHRLHVKSFLAGKRGICPDCGVGVDIPLRSDPRAEKKKGGHAFDGDAETVFDPEIPLPPAANSHPAPVHASHPVTVPTLPTAAAPIAPVHPHTQPTPGGAMAVQPVPVSVATQPVRPVMPVGPMAEAVGTSVAVAPVSVAPVQPVTAVGMNTAAIPAMPAMPVTPAMDPITEAPMAIWYVRPLAGGQFGPARGDVMRSWVNEGRVTADSMVWREGWPDWRVASKVFANLPATSPDVAPVAETPRRTVRSRAKSSSSLGVAIVVLLALIAVGLGAALIYVLNRGST